MKIKKVALVYLKASGREEAGHYLQVTDDTGALVNSIYIGNFNSPTSGIQYREWKHSTRKKDKGKRVIGVYFWVSAMGHELDQWRYYDLDASKDVT